MNDLFFWGTQQSETAAGTCTGESTSLKVPFFSDGNVVDGNEVFHQARLTSFSLASGSYSICLALYF